MKILVIEDDAALRESLLLTLASRDNGAFSPEGAGTLAEGVELLRQNGYRAALVDLGLPDSKDLDTVRGVKAVSPDTALVVFSAQDSIELAIQTLEAGAHDYIVKPASPELIERSIKMSIGRVELEKSQAREASYRAGIHSACSKMEKYIEEIKHFRNGEMGDKQASGGPCE